ncbi:Rz1 family lipoprotein [Escherichia coli]|nr:Rz1 family lipoprotein [Escherichia coli]
MRKLKMMLCVMMLPLVVVGCASKHSVRTCIKPPPPPAWMMQPAPDLLTPLNGIISPSENESQPATK